MSVEKISSSYIPLITLTQRASQENKEKHQLANTEHGGITTGGKSKVNTPFGGELAGAGKQEMEGRGEDVFDNESARVSSTCFVSTMAFVEKSISYATIYCGLAIIV